MRNVCEAVREKLSLPYLKQKFLKLLQGPWKKNSQSGLKLQGALI